MLNYQNPKLFMMHSNMLSNHSILHLRTKNPPQQKKNQGGQRRTKEEQQCRGKSYVRTRITLVSVPSELKAYITMSVQLLGVAAIIQYANMLRETSRDPVSVDGGLE